MARIDDGWKDELLARPYLTGLELLQLDSMRRDWVMKFPHVWSSQPAPNRDVLLNLLHRDNWKEAAAHHKRPHEC